jgi:hypothetical protein
MPTTRRQTKNTVPVGKTPVSKYASWDEHREAMRLDSEARRAELKQRQVKTVIDRRSLV